MRLLVAYPQKLPGREHRSNFVIAMLHGVAPPNDRCPQIELVTEARQVCSLKNVFESFLRLAVQD